jgi:FixJ family two-component response regulator
MQETPVVVVVEDDPASRKTLSRVLRAGGFEPALYASAEDYLASPPPKTPLGMLLDIHLPTISGLELQSWLRSQGSVLPIIIITAFDDARAKARAEALGCVAYLHKPCEAQQILNLLRSLVQS